MGQAQAIVAPGSAPAELRRLATHGGRLEDVCEIDRSRKPLGKGSFGTVWRGTLRGSGDVVAVKALDKGKMQSLRVPVSMIAAEVELMRECSAQDRVVRLLAFVDTSSSYFIVLEFCDGGNLEDAAKSDQSGFGEQQVVRLTRQLLEGIAFLHSKAICHRDIKPQNAMLAGGGATSAKAQLKLGDFGLAVRMTQGVLLKEKVGTPAFMAPEMHLLPSKSAGYDLKVDMWAAGALLVFLLANEFAFVDKHGRLLHHQLLRGDVPLWDSDTFSGLFQKVKEVAGIGRKAPSKAARDLVRQLLTPKRQHRPSAARALHHEWLRKPSAAPSATPAAAAGASPAAASPAAASPAAASPTAAPSPRRAARAPTTPARPAPEPSTAHASPPRRSRGAVTEAFAEADSSPTSADAAEPLLNWKEFEEGLSGIEAEFHRLAAGVVDAVGSVQVNMGGWDHKAPLLESGDDRLTSCVVCYQPISGTFSFRCSQCHHTVCSECLRRLPKPECPHCRHEATDVFLAQKVSWLAQSMNPEAAIEASNAALRAAVENPLIGRLGEVDAGIASSSLDVRPLDPRRSAKCHFCQEPSSATNHVCPLCHSSVCFGCAKKELSANPHCPACGEVDQNAAALAQYLAAGEMWAAAVDFASAFPEALSRSASGAFEALRTGAGSWAGSRGLSQGLGSSPVGRSPAARDSAHVMWDGLMGIGRDLLTQQQQQQQQLPTSGEHPARPDGLPGGFPNPFDTLPTSTGSELVRTPRRTFAEGEVVEYFGATQARWIPARVVKANPDGTYDLDCKPAVRGERLRRPEDRWPVAAGDATIAAAPGVVKSGRASLGSPLAALSPEQPDPLPETPRAGLTVHSGGSDPQSTASGSGAELPAEPLAQQPLALPRGKGGRSPEHPTDVEVAQVVEKSRFVSRITSL